MHLLPLHLDIKGHCSCFCLSLNSHQELLTQFLPNPENPAFGDSLPLSVGIILFLSPLMFNFALGCLLTYFFQVALLAK